MVIQASVSGSTAAPDRDASGNIVLDGSNASQRVALLVANGSVYFGMYANPGPYHGWLLRYDAVTLQLAGVFNASLNGSYAGIWQMGRGAAADTAGNVYAVSANGDYDGVSNFGQSILRFGSSGLSLADWFTPADNAETSAADLDLGLNGPILVPGTNLLIAGGKTGMVYLVNRLFLGHLENSGAPVQSLQASPYCGAENCYHQQALWARSATPILYVWRKNDVIRGYRLIGGQLETVPFSTGSDATVIPGSGMTVSSHGDEPNTGIVWSMGPVDDGRDTLREFGGMTVRAYDALDLTKELWNSSMNAARDDPGYYAKFAAPVVANGKVFVPTFSNHLVVYGLLNGAAPGLQVNHTADAATVPAGTAAGYAIVVSNSNASGTGAATAVVLNDPLPAGTGLSWRISPDYAGAGTCSITGSVGSQVLGCNFGRLAAGATATVHVTSDTSIRSCGAYANTATVTADNSSPVQASAAFAVECPVLSISKSHTDEFHQAQAGVTYSVVVRNSATTAATNGDVTVTEAVPEGITLVSMSGAGWDCSGKSCTRSDVLSAGASYPAITVTVSVSGTAALQATNQVSVSGGGSSSADASDVTRIGEFSCDVNGDRASNVADVQLVINEALGAVAAVHDLNHDSVINVADVQKMVNAALGLGCLY